MGTTDYLTSAISNSRVISWTSYNEWGEITHNAVLKCGHRELDLVKNYTGHEYDSVLDMYYAKARMYDADNRRFAAVDLVKGSVVLPQTLVPYVYVVDNPLKYVDPLGLLAYVVKNERATEEIQSTGTWHTTPPTVYSVYIDPPDIEKMEAWLDFLPGYSLSVKLGQGISGFDKINISSSKESLYNTLKAAMDNEMFSTAMDVSGGIFDVIKAYSAIKDVDLLADAKLLAGAGKFVGWAGFVLNGINLADVYFNETHVIEQIVGNKFSYYLKSTCKDNLKEKFALAYSLVEQAYSEGRITYDKENNTSSFVEYELMVDMIMALKAFDEIVGESNLLMDKLYKYYQD